MTVVEPHLVWTIQEDVTWSQPPAHAPASAPRIHIHSRESPGDRPRESQDEWVTAVHLGVDRYRQIRNVVRMRRSFYAQGEG